MVCVSPWGHPGQKLLPHGVLPGVGLSLGSVWQVSPEEVPAEALGPGGRQHWSCGDWGLSVVTPWGRGEAPPALASRISGAPHLLEVPKLFIMARRREGGGLGAGLSPTCACVVALPHGV